MAEAIGSALDIVIRTIDFVDRSVDDWNQALPEAHAFKRDLKRFKNLIMPFAPPSKRKDDNRVSAAPTLVAEDNKQAEEPLLYPRTPPPVSGLESDKVEIDIDRSSDNSLKEIIEEIVEAIEEAKKYVQEFIDDEKRKKSYGLSIKWFLTRLFTSGDYRLYFAEESARIRLLLSDLMLHQQIVESVSKPSIDRFEDDMSIDSYMFWSKHLGKETVVPWIEFRDAYNLMYGTLEPMDREYLYSVLCAKNDERVTVYGFISFTRKHGFPFEKDLASRTEPVKAVMTEEGRMEIAKMVMGLVNEFSSPTMKGHLVAIYTWYGDLSKARRKAKTEEQIEAADRNIQKRANEWAKSMKEKRRCSVSSKAGDSIQAEDPDFAKRAEELDSARRAISLFYQQYMVMWRIGQVSREMFKDVDFPGKARIKDFILLVQPLDKANFEIVIGGDAKNWDSKRPKVYDFLNKMLE